MGKAASAPEKPEKAGCNLVSRLELLLSAGDSARARRRMRPIVESTAALYNAGGYHRS
jgi:hypothetical protein